MSRLNVTYGSVRSGAMWQDLSVGTEVVADTAIAFAALTGGRPTTPPASAPLPGPRFLHARVVAPRSLFFSLCLLSLRGRHSLAKKTNEQTNAQHVEKTNRRLVLVTHKMIVVVGKKMTFCCETLDGFLWFSDSYLNASVVSVGGALSSYLGGYAADR